MSMKFSSCTRRFALLGLGILVAFGGACAHGRFVGTNYVPDKTYAGDERPDTELASVGSGVHLGPKAGSAVVIGDDILHAVLTSVDGKSCSGSVIQMLPGTHTLRAILHSSPGASGHGIRWKESKPFDVNVEVEKGVAYNLMAALDSDGNPSAVLKKLCASSDHIDTIKSFQQYGEMSCKQ
jgi:hypothetical protein